MTHFHAIETERGEASDPVLVALGLRVRPDRNTAGGVNECDAIGQLDTELSDVAALAITEVPVERLAHITHPTASNERTRDMRALKIIPPTGAPMATEADTSTLADDIQLQALLAHVAAAFDVEVPEDLGPDLATAALVFQGGHYRMLGEVL